MGPSVSRKQGLRGVLFEPAHSETGLRSCGSLKASERGAGSLEEVRFVADESARVDTAGSRAKFYGLKARFRKLGQAGFVRASPSQSRSEARRTRSKPCANLGAMPLRWREDISAATALLGSGE